MDIEAIKKLTLGDLQELHALHSMSLKDGLPLARQFRDRHELSDKETQLAFTIANRIFDNRD